MIWRKPITVGVIGVLVTVVLVLMVVIVLLRTGDAKAVSDNAALIGALAGLGGVFTTQMVTSALEDQRRGEARRTEEDRVRETRRIEERRTQEARDIEEQRVQEAALQHYFPQMGQLLMQGLRRPYTKEVATLLEQGLLKPQDKDEERIYEERQLRSLADVQTDRILRRLAPQRKWLVLQFLQASSLIDRQAPIVNLARADLREAILCEYISQDDMFVSQVRKYLRITADSSKYLSKSDLSGVLESTDDHLDYLVELLQHPASVSVNLAWASLPEVVLVKAYLRNATLSEADLSGAYLIEADLIQADLSNAYLGGAWLEDAVLIAANLNMANLNRVHLYGAVLVKADLSNTSLYEADLTEANLRQANLSGANLKDANLTRANLRNAKGATQEQLEKAAKTLEGATMPDGQKYEDWLKSKGSGEDEENSGSS